MADMFDPSVAEKIARYTVQIAGSTAKINNNMQSANIAAGQLVTRMQLLTGHTTGAATAAKNITANLSGAIQHSKNIASNVSNVNDALTRTPKEIEKSSQSMLYLKTALEGAAVYILGDMVNALDKLHSAGFAPSEVAAQGLRSVVTEISMLLQGMPVSATTIAGAITGLTKSLGGAKMFSNVLVQDVAELNSLYGVSLETGGKVTSMLYRWSSGSEKTVKNTLDFAKGLADATGVPIGSLLEDMAKNSALVARYGAQGAEAFLRQAVELRRMGTTFPEMSKFSDKLVDDFESTLKATAKIQTFLPGFNMAGIQFAAQFGTEADVAKELQSSLRGAGLKDLSQLPRSLRNALSNSLGMNQETLQNLMHPIKPTQPDKTILPKDIEAGTEKIYNVLIKGFKDILLLLATAASVNIARTLIQGKAGGFISKLLPGAKPVGALAEGAAEGAGAAMPAIEGYQSNNLAAVAAESAAPEAVAATTGVSKFAGAASKLGKVARGATRVLGVAGSVYQGYETYKETGSVAQGVGNTVGGLAGAEAGAAAGAGIAGLIGSVVPVIGTAIGLAIGGLIGGIAGYFSGGWLGKKVGKLFDDIFGTGLNDTGVAKTTNDVAEANKNLVKSIGMVQDKFTEVGGQNFGFAKQLFESHGGTIGVPSTITTVAPPTVTPPTVTPPTITPPTTSDTTTPRTPIQQKDTTPPIGTDMGALLQAVQKLETAYRSTTWDINLDGKKVGAGILAANARR